MRRSLNRQLYLMLDILLSTTEILLQYATLQKVIRGYNRVSVGPIKRDIDNTRRIYNALACVALLQYGYQRAQISLT